MSAGNMPIGHILQQLRSLDNESTTPEIAAVAWLAHDHASERVRRSLLDRRTAQAAADSVGQILDDLEDLIKGGFRYGWWMVKVILEIEEDGGDSNLLRFFVPSEPDGRRRKYDEYVDYGAKRTASGHIVTTLHTPYQATDLRIQRRRRWPLFDRLNNDGELSLPVPIDIQTMSNEEAQGAFDRADQQYAAITRNSTSAIALLITIAAHGGRGNRAQRRQQSLESTRVRETNAAHDDGPPGRIIASSPHLTNAPPRLLAAPLSAGELAMAA